MTQNIIFNLYLFNFTHILPVYLKYLLNIRSYLKIIITYVGVLKINGCLVINYVLKTVMVRSTFVKYGIVYIVVLCNI